VKPNSSQKLEERAIIMHNKHHKHGKNIKPNFGNYGRIELAFVGTTCSTIQKLVLQLLPELSASYSVAYLDAQHNTDAASKNPYIEAGASISGTDQQNQFLFNRAEMENRLYPKMQFDNSDLVLINGNHFVGTKQILFVDKKKADSLKRNAHKITDILMVIDVDGDAQIPEFISNKEGIDVNVPIFGLDNLDSIAQKIASWMSDQAPELHGLVLSGGLSKRMGLDKGELDYHGVSQHDYVADLLTPYCEEVRISVRQNQKINSKHKTFEDAFHDMGPLGAILTAFRNQPNVGWLVMACDLPLADKYAVHDLIQARKVGKNATAYKRTDGEWPEPLFAIYEPKIYSRALQMLSLGIQCPRKLIINSDIAVIHPKDDKVLKNANLPEERATIMELIRNGG
jgi:molybdenum cofactor guanylyltransferase